MTEGATKSNPGYASFSLGTKTTLQGANSTCIGDREDFIRVSAMLQQVDGDAQDGSQGNSESAEHRPEEVHDVKWELDVSRSSALIFEGHRVPASKHVLDSFSSLPPEDSRSH